ncbi:MAG: cupin domain-containing protein [Methylococcaceae bacterium]|nr:cupin domain-containing protein [Methylococcaceae bacterium]
MSPSEPEELQELAALYALGLLEESARRAFESRMKVDSEAESLVSRFGDIATSLLEVIPSKTPPPSLRERLLSRLPAEAKESPLPAEVLLGQGILLVHGRQKPWEETGIPGIRKKTLFYDAGRHYASNLVSMEAGSIYPRHRHADLEELYMLSGQIRLSGHRLGVGDYCRAEPGTLHDDVVAESDCLFIALASTRNEFCRPPA